MKVITKMYTSSHEFREPSGMEHMLVTEKLIPRIEKKQRICIILACLCVIAVFLISYPMYKVMKITRDVQMDTIAIQCVCLFMAIIFLLIARYYVSIQKMIQSKKYVIAMIAGKKISIQGDKVETSTGRGIVAVRIDWHGRMLEYFVE